MNQEIDTIAEFLASHAEMIAAWQAGRSADIATEIVESERGVPELRTLAESLANKLRREKPESPSSAVAAQRTSAEETITEGLNTSNARLYDQIVESERLFQTAFRKSPLGQSISRLKDGTFVDANEALASILGTTREELIGRNSIELGLMDEQTRSKVIQRVHERGSLRDRTVTIRNRNGEERHLLVSYEVVEIGGEDSLLAMVVDITSLKNTSEALARSEARLRETFDNLIVGCQILDAELRYVYLNANAASHGRRKPEELIGKRLADEYPGVESTTLYQELQNCLKTGVSKRMDNEFLFPDGSSGIFELSVQPVPEGLLILSAEVTEQRQLEAQLLESQKMEAVGRLAGGIAHDFNNMLTVINGYGDLVLSELKEADPHRSVIATMCDAGERAAKLTHQLLAFSRKAAVKPRTVDLNRTVQDLSELLQRLIGEDILYSIQLAPGLWRIKIDAGQLEQLIMNLVVNARDAMPEGGRLIISTRNRTLFNTYQQSTPGNQEGNYVQLAVTDTGIGMTADVRKRIFEPFFTTKEIGKGTGLGLAVVHGIVTQCGGVIQVESDPGAGTTFRILFPVAGQQVSTGDEIFSRRRTEGSETILVVEDDPAVRKVTQVSLESQGYTVLTADGGAEAIRIAREYPGSIDLLLSDVVMPVMGGRKVAEAIHSLRPHLPVLFMSGYVGDPILQHGMSGSNEKILAKPFTCQTLSETIRGVLDESED